MKKRMLSALTALCCACAMTLPVFAYTDDWKVYPDVENDVFMIDAASYSRYFLVETDGTELTAEMLGDISSECEVFPAEQWYEEEDSWYLENAITPIREYDIPENSYIIVWNAIGWTNLERDQFGRKISTVIDCVKEVNVVSYTWYYEATLTSIAIQCKDETMILNEEIIPELSDYTYTASEGSCICKIPTDEDREVYPSGTVKYSVFAEHQAVFEAIAEKYSDIIECYEPLAVAREGGPPDVMVYEPLTPIWQTAGDHNADGETNANDAADLLVQAAQEGVAEASETAVSPDSDVNLDGAADSTDAAYILQYSALKGSGADADWVEILKK